MKPLPRDSLAKQQRSIDALLGDIRDRDATGFPRLDAMRFISFTIHRGGNRG